MIPASHHGSWRGPNRLWLEDPKHPERCVGTIEAADTRVRYQWTFRDAPHHGEIVLTGPAPALKAEWKDSFHMKDGTVLHGRLADRELVLYCTYPAGEGPDWGWTIELDARDPEHLELRMFNVFPDGTKMIAVDLRAARA